MSTTTDTTAAIVQRFDAEIMGQIDHALQMEGMNEYHTTAEASQHIDRIVSCVVALDGIKQSDLEALARFPDPVIRRRHLAHLLLTAHAEV